MPQPIECIETQHVNMVTRDFDATVAHFQKLFGAQFARDIPAPEWHAGLIYMCGVLFEIFSPHQWLANGRYGPHWVGLEYQIDDVAKTRRLLAEHGVGLVRDIEIAIHTDAADTVGVAFEFYDQSFYSFDDSYWPEPLKPAEYWRDENPLGCFGLKRYSVVVADHEAALKRLRDLFVTATLYDEARDALGGRVTGLQMADSVLELMSPTTDGPLRAHHYRYGDGMRSVAFQATDLDRVRRHFEGQGIALETGDRANALALPATANLGLMMEFEL
ncbi:MAG: VOC family protein [Acidimicrobiia bacterium]